MPICAFHVSHSFYTLLLTVKNAGGRGVGGGEVVVLVRGLMKVTVSTIGNGYRDDNGNKNGASQHYCVLVNNRRCTISILFAAVVWRKRTEAVYVTKP